MRVAQNTLSEKTILFKLFNYFSMTYFYYFHIFTPFPMVASGHKQTSRVFDMLGLDDFFLCLLIVS